MRMGWILILAALGPAACGGGGGGGGDGDAGRVFTIVLESEAALDGYLLADGRGGWDWEPGWLASLTGELYTADEYVEARQFYTFDHPALPEGASIVRATLRLYQVAVEGDPFATLGDVVVDQVHYDLTMRASYFDGNTFNREIATLSTDAAIGYREGIVTSAVRIDLAEGRTRSQFRLRVIMPGIAAADGHSDYVQFTDAEGSAGDTTHPPVLILEVLMP